MLDRRSNQNLRIGPRNEHSWADMEVDVPERAATGDVSHGLAPTSPFHHGPEALGNGPAGRREYQFITIDVECFSHQQLGVEASRVASFAQVARSLCKRASNELHVSSRPAIRSASSSSTNSSMISGRPS